MVPLFSRRRGTPLHYSLRLIQANDNRCTVMRCNSKINCSIQFFRHVIILAPIVLSVSTMAFFLWTQNSCKWVPKSRTFATRRSYFKERALKSGKSKWGLSNGGLRPLSAICTQSSTIVHFCGFFGPLSKGNFRHKMTTIVGNRGQLWTSTLRPHLLSPHLDFPD